MEACTRRYLIGSSLVRNESRRQTGIGTILANGGRRLPHGWHDGGEPIHGRHAGSRQCVGLGLWEQGHEPPARDRGGCREHSSASPFLSSGSQNGLTKFAAYPCDLFALTA